MNQDNSKKNLFETPDNSEEEVIKDNISETSKSADDLVENLNYQKSICYDYDNISTKMSDEGQLLEHLYLSGVMVEEKLIELDIPKELSNQLLHIILSHHGDVQNGWGSIVDPKTPEAVALHYADLLDARVRDML